MNGNRAAILRAWRLVFVAVPLLLSACAHHVLTMNALTLEQKTQLRGTWGEYARVEEPFEIHQSYACRFPAGLYRARQSDDNGYFYFASDPVQVRTSAARFLGQAAAGETSDMRRRGSEGGIYIDKRTGKATACFFADPLGGDVYQIALPAGLVKATLNVTP
jgi:hypothetical protein